MGISRNCGLSIKITSVVEVILEILACALSVALCSYAWIKQTEKVTYFYSNGASQSFLATNKKLTACVAYWVLTLILLTAIVRISALVALSLSIRKNSPSLAQIWIGTKVLLLIFSSFLLIAAMTVDTTTRIAACVDFIAQLITSYFICILIPELEIMTKVFVVAKVKEST